MLTKEPAFLSPRFKFRPQSILHDKTSHVVIKDLQREFSDADHTSRKSHECCPLCHHQYAYLIAEKDRYGLPVETLLCKHCSLVFSGSYFSDEYASEYYGSIAITFKQTGVSLKELFEQRSGPNGHAVKRWAYLKDSISQSSYNNIQTVVEIGCSDGANLYPYHKDGKEVHGFDFDTKRIAEGKRHGLSLHHGDIHTAIDLGLKADLVVLSHFVEHLVDIDVFLGFLKKIMKEGALLYVEVPGLQFYNCLKSNTKTIDGHGGGNNLLAHLQVEHNFFFELKTLSCFFTRCGFSLVKGDEIIRSVFNYSNDAVTTENKPIGCHQTSDALLQQLQEIEKDYQKNYFRKIRNRMARLVKNKAGML